jgi:hypothetical protein
MRTKAKTLSKGGLNILELKFTASEVEVVKMNGEVEGPDGKPPQTQERLI